MEFEIREVGWTDSRLMQLLYPFLREPIERISIRSARKSSLWRSGDLPLKALEN